MYPYEHYLHKRPSGTKAELYAFANNVIKSFFENFTLDESLDQLRQMSLHGFFRENDEFTNPERCNHIAFYESLHILILASSIFNDELKKPV
ncbi:MAG: hypothetical protein P0Y49_08470 [Candidatus Pedobacter colombiensis]|uniref:Uncharacterized protein n=1 Tax=Candidatus Pedobacter colombiensis TaxID=3121371 RepID=A0AAJ5W9D0_9SPHI|nr:hypothetical protein [Pedobacter sp.]WEK21173.1 MAG: hypothetical protein P0Y49_08470 [Pedobacter sp.]